MAHDTAHPTATIALTDGRESPPTPAARRFVLLAIGVGALMTSLDSSIVNAVLPVITQALDIAMAGAVFSTLLSQAGAEPSNVSLIGAIRAAFLLAAGCTGLGALASFVRDRPDLRLGELEFGG